MDKFFVLMWLSLVTVLAVNNVTAAPNSLIHYTKQKRDIKELLNPVESVNENDADVDELHSWGSRTNPGKAKINSTAAKTANKEDKDEKRSTDKGDLINEFTTSRDTPRDMAEYIFWTGDEKGVTTAIKEFVDQGLISPSEGITFLEEVRFFLGQMQQRYGPIMDAGIEATAVHNKAQTEKLKYKTSEDDSSDAKAVATAANSVMKSISKNHHGDANEKSKHQGEILVTSFGAKDRITADKPTEVKDSSAEEIKSKTPSISKEQVMESIPLAETSSGNELNLEEIIYQLARILFSQSLSQGGNPEAEETLQKFADFIEKESDDGKLTPQLQRRVLDVLLMSLFDAIGDQKGTAGNLAKMAMELEKKKRTLLAKH